MIEVREAPVPVRYRWSVLGGVPMPELWFNTNMHDQCTSIGKSDALTVELSNGQIVIVRAKK